MKVFPSSEDVRTWVDHLEEMQDRCAPSFERAEPHQRAKASLRGEFAQHRAQKWGQCAEIRGTRPAQDPRGVLGMIAEPTGTDGLRAIARPWHVSPSCLKTLQLWCHPQDGIGQGSIPAEERRITPLLIGIVPACKRLL